MNDRQQFLLDQSTDVVDIRTTTLIFGAATIEDLPEALIPVDGGYLKDQIIEVLNA